MQKECKLSIITINYNGIKDTCELIDSIPFYNDMEVIVVDNASKEDEASIIANQYPQVKIIRSSQNLGFAGGNNLGIKEAKGKYLLFINNDTYFRDFNVDSLIKRLESSDKIGIVCPKLRFAWGNYPIQFAGYTPLSPITMRNKAIGFGEDDHGQYNTAYSTPYAHGAAMLIKHEAINKVGLMPECYFLYYEELDWSMMFTRAGYEIWYDPACTVYHKESQTTGQNSPLRTYYITRNRLLIVKRNYKGINKYLSYTYLIGIVAPRDIIKYTLQGRFDLIKAVYRGIKTFNSQISSVN
ncbi:MAG: glycosyltransferase family 2 protein [Prevotella ruminicola]|uniref:Glycosyltransferase family 2 protein n=1 Tax=Xylanibacter ruminicola TaxID=839 RepID=A0A9D5SBM4_XYLRU|nr:glycosyltransferase family 2 protein [Xylanibacter ruminicola]